MKQKKWMTLALAAALSALVLSGCGQDAAREPVTIEVWHYYNGAQQEAFDALVQQFNETTGKEKGITVQSAGQGSVADLSANVLASIHGEVGASEMPDIFAAYIAEAYTADMQGMVVNLRDYLTEEEIDSYVEGYIKEGDFAGNEEIKIFPIAKSTEVMVINRTDWDIFASATGASYDDIATLEGLVKTAQSYYEWTDARTPEVPNDGKAFFGRDSMGNYMLIASMQLGTEIFTVEDGKMTLNFDEDTIRRLWDCYYIPYVKGYFAALGHFRSDDLKTGSIISYVGSSAGAAYYPSEISVSDTERYPIEITVLPAPRFEGGSAYAVQQGAGMVVTKGTEQEIQASVEFLKWFTEEERNIIFATQSGYLPVKKAANEQGAVLESGFEITENVKLALTVAIDTVNDNYMYTAKGFEGGTEARDVLENAMSDRAMADRATVVERLASGMSLEEATAEFCSDAHFQAWYEATKTMLEECTAE